MTTGTYTVAAGESMAIKAKKQYSSGTLSYQYSTDGGETWSTAQSITPSSTSYEIVAISGLPAGSAKIKFTGTYIDIERIYGYTAVQEPVMTLSPAATTYDFGMQTAAADYEMTVTNSGTAEMTGMTATLSGDDAADYQVALSIPDGSTATITENVATIPVGQTVKVTATLKTSTEYKEHTATLTISATDLASKAITLTGKTRDASKWYVDFADGSIPSSFVEKGSWSVSSQAAYSGSGESSLISQPIDLAAGEKIYFDAKKPSYGSPSLKVRYSVNGGISWSDYVDYASAISSSAYSSHEIDLGNSDAVTAIVEFKGNYYMYLDNIYGGTLAADAPMVSVKKGGTAVESGTTESFGQILAEATAAYTITNMAGGTLTITEPVTVTGGASATVSATSLTSGQSATLTITMPVASPYGEKSGAVTVATSLGDFVINYTATTLDPDALNIDFADNTKPAGWYFGSNWSVSGQQATQESGTASDIVTQKLTVAGASDALTFQAARSSNYSAPTFKVYTSQDRANWTEVDLSDVTLTTAYQTVTVSGLTAGDYYVKISGSRVKVDNFLGWTKAALPEHDLYVTSTSFPTTAQTVGNTISCTANVISLIASSETDVYAKLFINGSEVETAEKAAVTSSTTTAFSMNYTLPATVGTVKAQIKVYYSDGTEAFATAVNDIVVDYPSLSLYETDASLTLTAGTYNVTLDHDFVAGWNTVCLPFGINVTDIHASAVAYAFTKYNTSSKELTFTKATTLTAGQPYVIYTPEAISTNYTFNGVTIADANLTAGASTDNGVTFQGTYTKVTFSNIEGDQYGLTAAGKIAKASASATMKGFRGYFTGLPAGARVTFNNLDETTGIRAITVDTTAPEGTYNLQGQKVEQLNKNGLYIINGRKVIVK